MSTLVINAGSSSVKCALFSFSAAPSEIVRETLDGAGPSVLPRLLQWIDSHAKGAPLTAIGHRIVHGGATYHEPQLITTTLVADLERLVPFAPNHLPDEIALIKSLGRTQTNVPQFACFDTAFHADLPELARRLPLPDSEATKGVRRYGFHGLSYSFLLEELAKAAGRETADGRVILAHLGNGSSLAAVHHGRSVDTTMAFTPIGGVIMSTRSGDLDPGVVCYLERAGQLSVDAVEDLLSHRAGLLGLSGSTGDMRVLLEREGTDPACGLAVSAYAYSVRKAIGALSAALGGLDTLVFSGGIGEHAPRVRARICDGLAFLGVQLDDSLNAAGGPTISRNAARVVVRVIPTNEELMIARAAYPLLAFR